MAFPSLPPGCRFNPSEEQLLCYYLSKKNRDSSDGGVSDFGFHVIRDVNLYDYEPFDLPEVMSFPYGCGGRRRHWYCYMPRAGKRGGKRSAGAGFWKRKGVVRDVMGKGGKVVLGKRKSFVFYLGNSQKNLESRTDWVMHEYALAGHSEAYFVLCRVFVKSPSRNNASENGLSSCAEESVATVKHIGIQHDESDSRGNEAQACLNDYAYQQNEFSSSGHACDGVGLDDDFMPAQQLTSLLQDDFIELDDLVANFPVLTNKE